MVRGRVQGVGFRWWTRNVAGELGLAGWVRNVPDGTVEVVAEGEEGAVGSLAERLKEGPPPARVDSVEERKHGGGTGSGRFEIRT